MPLIERPVIARKFLNKTSDTVYIVTPNNNGNYVVISVNAWSEIEILEKDITRQKLFDKYDISLHDVPAY